MTLGLSNALWMCGLKPPRRLAGGLLRAGRIQWSPKGPKGLSGNTSCKSNLFFLRRPSYQNPDGPNPRFLEYQFKWSVVRRADLLIDPLYQGVIWGPFQVIQMILIINISDVLDFLDVLVFCTVYRNLDKMTPGSLTRIRDLRALSGVPCFTRFSERRLCKRSKSSLN